MTTLTVVYTIVALRTTPRLVWWDLILTRTESDTVTDQDHGKKHLTLIILGWIMIGRRILRVVCEVSAAAVHPRIREAHIEAIL